MISEIAEHKVEKQYQLDKPKGVRGRSSDNEKILSDIKWKPGISLFDGLTKTYNWIFAQITKNSNNQKYTRRY